MNERTAPATVDCDHQPQGSQPEHPPEERIRYLCMSLHRWRDLELSKHDGSIGFMPVFDDVETLKAEYPDAEIMKITWIRD